MFYLRIDNESQKHILISLLDHEISAEERLEITSPALKEKKIIRDRLLVGTKRGEKNRN
jgi:hypothetical protein